MIKSLINKMLLWWYYRKLHKMDLKDIIYDISPMETPFVSDLKRKQERQTDVLSKLYED